LPGNRAINRSCQMTLIAKAGIATAGANPERAFSSPIFPV
jgi:hypothetical protein